MWQTRKAWLKDWAAPVPEGLHTPLQTAEFEARQVGAPVSFTVDKTAGESYTIGQAGDGWQITGGEAGVLYGVYALAHGLKTGKIPHGRQAPFYALRMINAWDNMDGTVERGYAGRSMWFEGGAFFYDPARIRQLGRLLASVGINTLCVNNVNVHQPAQHLVDTLLPDLAAFAELLRPFGVRLMISIDFSLPLQYGLPTADPMDAAVAAWWADRARAVWQAIPDLAGFLVKADSEHRPGPNAYDRTHAEGANMLARAIAPYGGVLVWRAFVYNCMQDWRDTKTDRPCAAYDLYRPLDGQFDGNVILQVKHGPFDFQVREPLSPLLLGMKNTAMDIEFQLAQEYTGHQIDLYAMPPMWREVFDQMGKERVRAIAAVSNLGRDENWVGHPFAMLNLFAYGRFAWNPDEDAEDVIRQWVKMTYDMCPDDENSLMKLLLNSRTVYEKYTAPLGLCWMVRPGDHYGPSPYGYEFDAWGTYNRASRDAVGIDRTEKGTGYAAQYPAELKALYEDPAQCPDEMLLFFHRLPYDHIMRDGRTLIQRIYDDHFEGCEETERMRDALAALSLPEPDRTEVMERMEMQIANAREWRDIVNTFFHRFSGVDDAQGRKIFE